MVYNSTCVVLDGDRAAWWIALMLLTSTSNSFEIEKLGNGEMQSSQFEATESGKIFSIIYLLFIYSHMLMCLQLNHITDNIS